MGGGLESRCVGRVYGVDGAVLQLNIWCSWWWAYVPETCRAKNISIKLPCCIKLAFHIISWGRCTVKQPLNLTRTAVILYEDRYTFLILSCSAVLRMRNVSDKSCRENEKTHFIINIYFFNLSVYEIIWKKYCRAEHATDGACALHVVERRLQTHTQKW